MNDRRKDEGENENGRSGGAANWLSDLARVYGTWHLAVTILQGALWACFVIWNEIEIGEHPHWRNAVQASATLVWQALPAFSITSAAILVAAQKGGRILLTFIDERRQRLMKVREEGREEGREEMVEALSQDPQIAAMLRENPRIRETLREFGIDPPDRKNGGD